MRCHAFLATLATGTLLACAGASSGPSEVSLPTAGISADVLFDHVSALSNDSLRGRYSPSPGLDAAARYAAARLEELGWQPLGDDGGYLQKWSGSFTRLDVSRAALAAEGCGETAGVSIEPRVALMYAGTEEVRAMPLVVPSIDELSTIDAESSFVVLRAIGGNPSAVLHEAMGVARSAGAAGIVVVVPEMTAGISDGLARMNHTGFGVAAALLAESEWSPLAALFERCPNASLVWRGPIRVDSGPVPNVVAVLKGTDPRLREEYVVVSAHLDHVGTGVPDATGDTIYNGADDNASGVAVALAVAGALSGEPPRRSVVVLLPGGEEEGMHGSNHFLEAPPVPVARMVANVNVDGVGRAWQRDTVSVAGFGYSTLGATVGEVLDSQPEVGLVAVADQWPERQIFQFSDQIEFARRGIPSIFFTSTGPDEHYHQPSDEIETLDFDHLTRVARLVMSTVAAVADADAVPEWDPAIRRQIVR